MRMRTSAAVLGAIVFLTSTGSRAGTAYMVISTAPTRHVTCSSGQCYLTGGDPILNVHDLETLLAAGNVTVSSQFRGTTYSVRVKNSFGWKSASTLTLTNNDGVYVDKPITVRGSGGLTIAGYYLSLAPRAKIIFDNLSGSLSLGGVQYALVNSLQGLASAIAANPQGYFAFAKSYDASADGTYSASPVPTNFEGGLEGLGNTISNISVDNTTACCVGGVFLSLSAAQISNFHLSNVNVVSAGGAAGLAYESFATIDESSVTGSVSGGDTYDTAGLVADNYGSLEDDSSYATVAAGANVSNVNVGGLVGANFAFIDESFATGSVSAGNGTGDLGGLVGHDFVEASSNSVENSYATGNVFGTGQMNVGGLSGENDYGTSHSSDQYAYSSGSVSGGAGSTIGGLVGVNSSFLGDDYWDTTTSGTGIGVGLGNAAGATGMTTSQLQSGLPPGFDTYVWTENPNVNGGLPYLVYNPPLQ